MLIFYIICACIVFMIAGSSMHFNRRAIYRRRIIRHYAQQPNQTLPFILSDTQEAIIKQCFLNRVSTQGCIDKINQQSASH